MSMLKGEFVTTLFDVTATDSTFSGHCSMIERSTSNINAERSTPPYGETQMLGIYYVQVQAASNFLKKIHDYIVIE